MKDAWDRIETWLESNAPDMLRVLRPGAALDAIRTTEATLSVTFPDDMVASYRIHDGQAALSYALMGEWELLSLEDVITEWDTMRDLHLDEAPHDEGTPTDPVRPMWWNTRWVPVAYNGGGDLQCVDLDPAPNGTVGQMTTFWHMDAEREQLAPTFRDWLAAYADDLEQGKYTVREGSKLILRERSDG